MNCRVLCTALTLTSLFAFSGCASKQIDPAVQSAHDRIQTSLKTEPVAVIGDGCLIRIEMGKNDIMYQQSDLASVAMAKTVSARLQEKGVKVGQVQTPFVCGTAKKEALLKMDILTTADAKDQLNTAYPILSSSNTFDVATNQAYLNLYRAMTEADKDIRKRNASQPTPLNLDATSLATIKQTANANKAFVTFVSGKKPSFGASMALGAVTVLASGGTMGYTLQEGQHYQIYLLDLQNNQVLWSRHGTVQGKVFKMPVAESFNQPELLTPLYGE